MGQLIAALSLGSGVVGAYGAYQKGQAEAASDKYNAQIALQNAQQARINAGFASEAGSVQAAQKSMQAKAVIGSIAANQGAGGISTNSGSALDTKTSTQELGQLDALQVRSNATKEAYGYQVQSVSDEAQARLDQQSAHYAKEASYVNAASTFLGSASDAAGNWQKIQMAGGVGVA
jgi:hypothetical protein